MNARAISSLAAFLLFTMAHAVAGARVVLPDAVVPTHYRIDFTPDIGALTFTRKVEIEVQVRRSTNAIVLNSAEITIDSATLAGNSSKPQITYDDKVETATFTFDKPITPGAYTLALTYHGSIHESASG